MDHLRRHHRLVIAFLLAVLTLATFSPVLRNGFVNYDDSAFVSLENPTASGLSLRGLHWAFTNWDVNLWHPLTWLSHMLDIQLFGMNPLGHHLISLLLHIANAVLLFLMLDRMTGAVWSSAVCAALFAVHPLHVESVAWVAERKDVLSTLLVFITVGLYAGYARRPAWPRYLALTVTYLMALMAKPMAVSLPIILLLLDYWPLRRLSRWRHDPMGQPLSARRHRPAALAWLKTPPLWVMDKIPLAVIALASSINTILWRAGPSGPFDRHPFWVRVANIPVSYVTYLWRMIWPAHLAVYYPHPGETVWPWQTLSSLAALILLTLLAFALRRGRGYLATGWLWFLVTLLPVIGLVPIGRHSRTDHYTYVPLIGIFLAVAWGLPNLLRGYRSRRVLLGAFAGVTILVLAPLSWIQAGHWRNSISLFTHALAVTQGNWLAHNNLAVALVEAGRLQEAVEHYREALRIRPRSDFILENMGVALARLGRLDESIDYCRAAVRLNPDDVDHRYHLAKLLHNAGLHGEAAGVYREILSYKPHDRRARNSLGILLSEEGHYAEAMAEFKRGLADHPENGELHFNLGNALRDQGRLPEAIEEYRQALRDDPAQREVRGNLALALAQAGRLDEAVDQYLRVIRQAPDDAVARNNYGRTLEMLGEGDQAMAQYRIALRIDPNFAEACNNLGIALSNQGKTIEAMAQFEEAIRIRPDYEDARENLAALRAVRGAGNPGEAIGGAPDERGSNEAIHGQPAE